MLIELDDAEGIDVTVAVVEISSLHDHDRQHTLGLCRLCKFVRHATQCSFSTDIQSVQRRQQQQRLVRARSRRERQFSVVLESS